MKHSTFIQQSSTGELRSEFSFPEQHECIVRHISSRALYATAVKKNVARRPAEWEKWKQKTYVAYNMYRREA